MKAELFRAGAETRDSDLSWSVVGPGHNRAYFSLIPLAGYSARSRLNDFPYFNGPFSTYSMSGWKSERLFKTVGAAKRGVRQWILEWLADAPLEILWSEAEETGVHWSAKANGIQVANYYFCPEPRGHWHKGFRVWFGGTYYVVEFESPEQARAACQDTYSRWLKNAREKLLPLLDGECSACGKVHQNSACSPRMNCPHCQKLISDSEIAAYIGSKSKGVKKSFSKAERERRRKRLAEVRSKRWPKKKRKTL